MLALIAVLGWVTLSLFGSLRDVQATVLQTAVPRLAAVDELVRSYTAQSAHVRGFLVVGERGLLDQYESEVAVARRLRGRAMRLFPEGRERDLLERLVSAGASFQDLVDDEVVPLTLEGKRSQAARVLGQEGSPLIEGIEEVGQQLRAAQDAEVIRTEAELETQSNRVVLTLVLVTAGALFIGVVLAVLLPRRLVANLDRLVDAARAIERGDFDRPVEVTSHDEVGELAERFEEMQAGLKRLQQLAAHDRELEIAGSIQRNLLQRGIPQASQFNLAPIQRQANVVGGDWYDFELTGDTLTVVVGDASGKGIGAALMSTVTLSSLRAERGLGAGPQRIIEQANKVLKDASEADSFTTMIYLTIDLPHGSVRWLNMGHLSPYVLRTSNGLLSGDFAEGLRNRVLGWFDDPGYQESGVDLARGDRLIVFTDGFLEAKAPEGELFGEQRLADALIRNAPLPPQQMGEALVAEVERFAAGKLDDDLTMLVIEYTGAVPEGDIRAGTLGARPVESSGSAL